MPIRVLTILAGLLAMLAVVACASESYNATQTAEAPTKEFEQAIEYKRKSVEDLPDCKGARDDVGAVAWKNRGNGKRYLSKIKNEYPVSVEITERTATITCGGEAWRMDGSYTGEITYWVRKNKRDQKGNRYAGYEVGAPN